MPIDSNLAAGARVRVKMNGTLVDAVYVSHDEKYDMPKVRLAADGRIVVRRVFEVVTPASAATATATVDVVETSAASEPTSPLRSFAISTRFNFLARMVTMVATGVPNALIITGSGGLGKSYTVMECLASAGLEEDVDFVVVRGHSTPKSLFRTLYENRDRIVVFDDCDSVLKLETCVNLLKAALDSNPVRTISWLTERSDETDGALPSRFNFEGKVIFISNQKLLAIPQPMLSRALYVDVSMTSDEKLERMMAIAPRIRPELDLGTKMEAIDFMRTIKDHVKDLNIRTLLKVLDIRASDPEQWREISEYVLTA